MREGEGIVMNQYALGCPFLFKESFDRNGKGLTKEDLIVLQGSH